MYFHKELVLENRKREKGKKQLHTYFWQKYHLKHVWCRWVHFAFVSSFASSSLPISRNSLWKKRTFCCVREFRLVSSSRHLQPNWPFFDKFHENNMFIYELYQRKQTGLPCCCICHLCKSSTVLQLVRDSLICWDQPPIHPCSNHGRYLKKNIPLNSVCFRQHHPKGPEGEGHPGYFIPFWVLLRFWSCCFFFNPPPTNFSCTSPCWLCKYPSCGWSRAQHNATKKSPFIFLATSAPFRSFFFFGGCSSILVSVKSSSQRANAKQEHEDKRTKRTFMDQLSSNVVFHASKTLQNSEIAVFVLVVFIGKVRFCWYQFFLLTSRKQWRKTFCKNPDTKACIGT